MSALRPFIEHVVPLRESSLRASNLKAARAWAIKEELRELWNRESLDDALTLWRRWDAWAMRSRLEPVKRVARVVKRHLGGILNYYVHRVTNALTESTNGTIEWIKRAARGDRNRRTPRRRSSSTAAGSSSITWPLRQASERGAGNKQSQRLD